MFLVDREPAGSLEKQRRIIAGVKP